MMDKETLQELYWKEELSENKIARRLGMSDGKVHHLLVKHGIPRRPRHPEPIETEALQRLYVEEELSQKNTAKRLGVDTGRVKRYMIRYGIPRREVGKITENGLKLLKKPKSEETRRKMREGSIEKNLGITRSDETKAKLSYAKMGDKNPRWEGGISFEPYSPEFNETLKRKIRERDNYTCQNPNCGNEGKEVHHIDYDKKNNDPLNLITLCKKCHPKTNGSREEWTPLFQNLMKSKRITL